MQPVCAEALPDSLRHCAVCPRFRRRALHYDVVVLVEVIAAFGIIAFVAIAWLRIRKGRWRAPDAPPFPDYGAPGGPDC